MNGKLKTKLRVVVVDGMGGGLGSEIVTRISKKLMNQVEIVALGTNAMATSRMIQSGAHRGATGENAIRININDADLIVGPLGIMMPNAMMGEVTPSMAEWIGLAKGKKLLLPVNQPHFQLVGMKSQPMAELLDHLISQIEGEIKA
ncbi:MAG: DUF3842 family protein [Halanaerobiales bacterium]|nr:DUF3842 family protein [Halanaerobiales bacterium]